MYIFVGINVEKTLENIGRKVNEINDNLGYEHSTLPLHISLKMSFEIDNGKVKAISPGTATITATAGNKTATYTVTVQAETQVSDGIPVYRMYNRHTGEHLYTTDAYEKYIL